MSYFKRINPGVWFILANVIISCTGSGTSLYAQSQDYPPAFLSTDFISLNWSVKDGLPVNSLSGVTQSDDGYIWLGTADGLVRFDGINFEVFNTTTYPDIRYNRIRGVANYDGGVLVLNDYGLISHFKDGKFSDILTPSELPLASWLVMIQNNNEEIYIIADEHVFEFRNDGIIIRVEDPGVLPVNNRRSGNYHWQAFQNQFFWNGQKVAEFSSSVNDAIVDREGNIWIATYSNGLYQLKRNYFRVFSEEEGLRSRNVYPVTQTKDGKIWTGTYRGGISSIDDKRVVSRYLIEGMADSDAFIQSFLERKNGDFLAADASGRIYRYTGEQIFSRYLDSDLGRINHLFEDSKGVLWIGTGIGLFYLENGKWVNIDIPRLANTAIKVITEAPDGSYWVGTAGKGLVQIKGVNTTSLDKETGLSSNIVRSVYISKHREDSGYDVWAGTEDQGINVVSVQSGLVDYQGIKSISQAEGLYDNGIHNIIPDDLGRVWMSSNRGIFWVNKSEVDQFIPGNSVEVISTAYTEKDGLRNREANGGIQPAGVKDKNGNIWFPTQDGVVMVDPGKIKRNQVPPEVHIKNVTTATESFSDVGEQIDLPLDERSIHIEFTALSYVAPERNRYRFRLFGFEDIWTETSDSRNIRYTNIPPGTYTFKVIASNNDGVWNQQGAFVDIMVPAHFYETNWFYGLIVLIILIQISVIFLIIRSKARISLEEKEKELGLLRSEINKLRSRLEDQQHMKQSLLFNLKNELRDPVLSLRESAESGSEALEKVVDRDTRKMLSQIDQILLLTEIEVEGIRIHPTLEDMVVLLKECIHIHKSEAGNKDPVIEFESNTEAVNIYVDTGLARLIFCGLLRNSTKNKSVTKVRVQIVEESSICNIKITDNGDPHSQKELNTIFSLFKEGAQDPEYRNELGIDLPLVAKLVELHKASIIVHSMPEKGNTYMVTFKKGSFHFEDFFFSEN